VSTTGSSVKKKPPVFYIDHRVIDKWLRSGRAKDFRQVRLHQAIVRRINVRSSTLRDGRTLEPGEFVLNVLRLAEELSATPRTVYRDLEEFVKSGLILLSHGKSAGMSRHSAVYLYVGYEDTILPDTPVSDGNDAEVSLVPGPGSRDPSEREGEKMQEELPLLGIEPKKAEKKTGKWPKLAELTNFEQRVITDEELDSKALPFHSCKNAFERMWLIRFWYDWGWRRFGEMTIALDAPTEPKNLEKAKKLITEHARLIKDFWEVYVPMTKFFFSGNYRPPFHKERNGVESWMTWEHFIYDFPAIRNQMLVHGKVTSGHDRKLRNRIRRIDEQVEELQGLINDGHARSEQFQETIEKLSHEKNEIEKELAAA